MTARIAERAALRYTPAGLPALDLSLAHADETEQLGRPRKVSFELRARALGPLAESLVGAALDVEHEFGGFLGAQRNGRGIVLHIDTLELNKGSTHAPAPR